MRPEAVAFARRPGTFAVVIDCAEGREVAQLHTPEDRHFYGHGAFTPDGTLLFTTENAIAQGTGRLGVWDASDGYKRIGEVETGGAGPHEVRLMPDGRRLAVANGGIETDPTSGRAELNIATMVSSLAYVDAETGAVLDVLGLAPEYRLLSIRHLAAGRDGTLAAALQWQGSELEAPPLLAVHRAGSDRLELLAAEPAVQRRTRNYAGSVAVTDDGRLAAYTAPRGNMMLIFDLAGADARRRSSRPPTSAASPPPAPASPARPAPASSSSAAPARGPRPPLRRASPSTTTSSASPPSSAA